MKKLYRILVAPGPSSEAIDCTIEYVCRLSRIVRELKIFIIGDKDVIVSIGKKLSKNLLKSGRVVLSRILLNRDHGSEALRIFIEVNPDLIVYIMYPIDNYLFKAELLYKLRYSKTINALSLVSNKYECVSLGIVVDSLEILVEKTLEVLRIC